MRPIDVDTGSYESARDTFYDVDSQACDAVLIAATGADGGAGMAGSDSTGADWARQYDQAASQALQAGGTLTETLGHIGDLLGASAANHGNADSSSIPGGGPTYGGGGSGKGASTVYPATPPSANGTPGDEPHGWSLIAHLISWTWPNGHQDQLRSVGSAWTRSGQALQDDSLALFSAVGQIESLQSPEVAAAAQTCRDVQTHMNDLGGAYTDIGKTCDDYAGFLDEAHHEVISELESLVAWTVGIEAAGALGSLITFGGAEVPAQIAEAGRIARTSARVGEILSKLAELTRGIIAVIGRALGKVGELLAKLKSLLSKGVSKAIERVGSKLPGGGGLTKRLDEAKTFVGRRLPSTDGPPNGILAKRAPDGSVTNYTVYDADGLATKRVDLTGRSHNGVETPHVVEYQRNVDPTGKVHVRPDNSQVRPATPDEIP